MTEEEYRKAEGINKSTLWEMRKSPAHYKYAVEHPAEDTAALRFGRALHSAVLTPAAYKREYVVIPDVDRRTKAGKEAYAAWKAAQPPEAEELTSEDAQTIASMVKAIRSNEGAMRLLKGARREVPVFWTDSKYGLRCKCRIDALGKQAIVDLKTISDMSTFDRDAERYGYALQAAHYIRAVESKRGKRLPWYFVAIEKKAPFGVKVIKATPGFIDAGDYQRDVLLEKVKACQESGEWPCYEDGETAEPRWMEVE